ncbi:homocitrate synthase lys21 [Neonectria punicea]|uniref:Homocitrate synthase lys21 n=1 Tax=Neonectria punicea TaxID=979145 RepID=A0ABR1GW37_9HYPO
MVVTSPEYTISKYNLKMLKDIEEYVASCVQVNIPFNNPIAVTRYISISSRITGWNAVKSRVLQLGYSLTDDQINEVTAKIKQMGDIRPLAVDDADSIIHSHNLTLHQEKVA